MKVEKERGWEKEKGNGMKKIKIKNCEKIWNLIENGKIAERFPFLFFSFLFYLFSKFFIF